MEDKVKCAKDLEEKRRIINERHMKNGVTIIDPKVTYIDETVEIGEGTVIYPGNILEGNTKIGINCILGQNNRIVDSIIDDGADVMSSVLIESKVGEGTHIGPFAYLRPNSNVGKNARIGDFVELKNSNIGDGTKVSHLTYVGDSDVGSEVNFGCGTVTVNYDGINKHRTTIGNKVFIGCNTNLVSPVKLGDGAYTAAGTTVTEDVPENALVIGRVRQEVKEGWAKGKTKVNK